MNMHGRSMSVVPSVFLSWKGSAVTQSVFAIPGGRASTGSTTCSSALVLSWDHVVMLSWDHVVMGPCCHGTLVPSCLGSLLHFSCPASSAIPVLNSSPHVVNEVEGSRQDVEC